MPNAPKTSTIRKTIDVSRPGAVGGGLWRLKNLNRITVIFGRNGAGKSWLLRNLRDQQPGAFHLVSPERGGTIGFEPQRITQELDGTTRADVSRSNLNGAYRQGAIARVGAYVSIRGAHREEPVPEPPQTIEQPFSLLLPDFEFKVTQDAQMFSLTRRSTGEKVTDVATLSSGETQLFTIGLDLLTVTKIWALKKQSETMLLIDEPDTNLHPDMQLRIADFIVHLAKTSGTQVLLTTHSTTLLAALMHHGRDEVGVIYMNNAQEEQHAKSYSKYAQELTACLGGHVLMGPLFGAKLLLVEGDDDYKVWSEVPRGNLVKCAVIPCNGDEIIHYQSALERILMSIQDQPSAVGYALLDSDKSAPASRADNAQIFVPFINLACHETENLYVTDEVLARLGYESWDAAKVRILERANGFPIEIRDRLLALQDIDRKAADLKRLVVPLMEILDEKQVPWHLTVGTVLKAGRPEGSMMDFLGQKIVDALWGVAPTEPFEA